MGKTVLPKHLVVISVCVFLGLNLVENLIHFSIGRSVDRKEEATFEMKAPGFWDMVKIIVVMVVFGLLQGFLTYWGVASGF